MPISAPPFTMMLRMLSSVTLACQPASVKLRGPGIIPFAWAPSPLPEMPWQFAHAARKCSAALPPTDLMISSPLATSGDGSGAVSSGMSFLPEQPSATTKPVQWMSHSVLVPYSDVLAWFCWPTDIEFLVHYFPFGFTLVKTPSNRITQTPESINQNYSFAAK